MSLRPSDGVWEEIVYDTKQERIHVGSLLQHATPEEGIQQGILQLQVPDEFHRRLLTTQKKFLIEVINRHIPVADIQVSIDPEQDDQDPQFAPDSDLPF